MLGVDPDELCSQETGSQSEPELRYNPFDTLASPTYSHVNNDSDSSNSSSSLGPEDEEDFSAYFGGDNRGSGSGSMGDQFNQDSDHNEIPRDMRVGASDEGHAEFVNCDSDDGPGISDGVNPKKAKRRRYQPRRDNDEWIEGYRFANGGCCRGRTVDCATLAAFTRDEILQYRRTVSKPAGSDAISQATRRSFLMGIAKNAVDSVTGNLNQCRVGGIRLCVNAFCELYNVTR